MGLYSGLSLTNKLVNPNRSACCANFTCSLKSICSLFYYQMVWIDLMLIYDFKGTFKTLMIFYLGHIIPLTKLYLNNTYYLNNKCCL